MSTTKKEARFDIRWSSEQKERFERAARTAGFSSLAQFVTSVVRDRAEEVLKEEERVLASERDQERFFDALMEDAGPNEELRKAAKAYKKGLDT